MPSYLVVDSSILIFYDRKGKLADFLLQKKKENYEVIIPKAIAQEVVDEPKEVAEKIRETCPELANRILDSVRRIKTAIEQDLIQVETVNYRKYSKTMDHIRKHNYYPGEFLIILLVVMVIVFVARILLWQSRRRYTQNWRNQPPL